MGSDKPSASLTLSALLLAVSLSSCGGSKSEESNYSVAESETALFDEGAAYSRAEEELAYESYGSVGAMYGCTDDCSGHDAGFEWAKNNGITDGSCYGDSQSFIEGCQAYGEAIEEKVEEYRDEFDSGNF